MMKKQIFTTCILLIFLMAGFSGCTDSPNENKVPDSKNEDQVNDEATTVDVPLNEIALTEKDFAEGCNMTNESYITQPYTEENMAGYGLLWNITEKYYAFLIIDQSIFIQETIYKHEASVEAKKYVELIKPILLEQNHTELYTDIIGDKSFLLNRTANIKENEIESYTLIFSVKNIVVSMIGIAQHPAILIDYGEKIEKRIMKTVEDH